MTSLSPQADGGGLDPLPLHVIASDSKQCLLFPTVANSFHHLCKPWRDKVIPGTLPAPLRVQCPTWTTILAFSSLSPSGHLELLTSLDTLSLCF
jgi:hypothetical protein